MDRNKEQTTFYEQVKRWALEALADDACTFEDVLKRLPGVYPSEALSVLRRLEPSLPLGFFEPPLGKDKSFAQQGVGLRWPVPHPLDYDWRFSKDTAHALASRCSVHNPSGEEIVLLGAPSLIPPLMEYQSAGSVTIIDANLAMMEALRRDFPAVNQTCLDLVRGSPVSATKAEVVVADPPWYPDYVHSFLWSARRLCRLGGHVLLSLPPLGTRPGIEKERIEIHRFATDLGLRVLSWQELTLDYLSPGFEQNALKAANLSAIPQIWRRGDLVTFKCAAPNRAPRPVVRAGVLGRSRG